MASCRPISTATLTAVALLLRVAAPTIAEAQWHDWRGGASITFDTRYGQVREAGEHDQRDHLASMGVAVRGMASPSWVHYAFGLDYQLGGTRPDGFLYQANLYPLGVGALLGPNASIGLIAGVGFSGVIEQVPFSAQFPIELALEFDLHRRVRVAGFGRAIWLTDNQREHGSVSHSGADALAAGVSLRWGKRYFPHDNRMSAGNGYFIGAIYQEQLGSKILTLTFGYSLNASRGRF